jgi:glycosyltransferase involved in cell wall biosynthesis
VIPHGSISEYQHRHSNKRKSFFRILCRALDSKYRIHFYVASEQERQDTLKYFPNNVSTLLGLWVPTSNIPKNRVRASKQNNLCVISRIHPIKNIEIILDAFNHLRNVVNVDLRLFIAGEGQDLYVQSLHRKVSDLHLHPYVEFLGHLDEIEKNVLWEKSDLLCQMSFYENFGQVVAESVMHGVPVIVSKYLGISSIIESTQTGLVVDPNNFEEIAEAIMLGLKNHSQLRENCINRRLIFSKDYVAERWIRQIKLDCDL